MNSISQCIKNSILDGGYSSTTKQTPLVFAGGGLVKFKDLQDLVHKIIVLTQQFPSKEEGGEIETSPGRWRSVTDIWRHVINTMPEATLADVMRAVYSIRHKLVGHYCGGIRRRVFRSKEATGVGSGYRLHTVESSRFDEFGLEFAMWEDIQD